MLFERGGTNTSEGGQVAFEAFISGVSNISGSKYYVTGTPYNLSPQSSVCTLYNCSLVPKHLHRKYNVVVKVHDGNK